MDTTQAIALADIATTETRNRRGWTPSQVATAFRNQPPILSAYPYVSSNNPNRSPEDVIHRLNAYALKNPGCPQELVEECAAAMAALIYRERCILVPVPDHNGNTAVNFRLAEAIALHARCSRVEVRDILARAEPVVSSCELHRRGLQTLAVVDHRIIARAHEPFHLAPIYFVDNVATSGNTITACAAALFGFGTGLVYAATNHRSQG